MAKQGGTPSSACGATPEQVVDHIRRISTLEAVIGTLKEDTDEIKETVHRIDRAIRGNERPGLMQRTASLEGSRDRADKRRRANRAWGFGLLASLCVAGVGAIIRWAWK